MPKATKIEEAAAATGQHMLHVDARRSDQAYARREGFFGPVPRHLQGGCDIVDQGRTGKQRPVLSDHQHATAARHHKPGRDHQRHRDGDCDAADDVDRWADLGPQKCPAP